MLRELLSNRLFIGALAFFVFCVAGSLLYMHYEMQKGAKELAETQERVKQLTEKPETPQKVPSGDTSQGGHWHGDEWHADPHETHEVPNDVIPSQPPVAASRDYTPTAVQIPEDITDPDVLAAWQRVDYIANNIWEWGGVPNAETPELIAKLMPAPDGFSGPTGHSDAEETIDLLGSLDRNDPRSIVVMATYLCEGLVGGRGPKNALVEMGVPVVPYLIPYMLDMERSPVLRSRALEVLCKIAERQREDLDGIVEHIIIPRLEAILSQEKPDYDEGKDAREYLPRLK